MMSLVEGGSGNKKHGMSQFRQIPWPSSTTSVGHQADVVLLGGSKKRS
jgi:hypothetical protein